MSRHLKLVLLLHFLSVDCFHIGTLFDKWTPQIPCMQVSPSVVFQSDVNLQILVDKLRLSNDKIPNAQNCFHVLHREDLTISYKDVTESVLVVDSSNVSLFSKELNNLPAKFFICYSDCQCYEMIQLVTNQYPWSRKCHFNFGMKLFSLKFSNYNNLYKNLS